MQELAQLNGYPRGQAFLGGSAVLPSRLALDPAGTANPQKGGKTTTRNDRETARSGPHQFVAPVRARPLRVAFVGIDGSGKSSCFRKTLELLVLRHVAGVGDEVLVAENGRLVAPRVPYIGLRARLGSRVKGIRNRAVYKVLKLAELALRARIQDILERRLQPELLLTDGSPIVNTLGWGSYYRPELYKPEWLDTAARYLAGDRIPADQRRLCRKRAPELLLLNLLRVRFQRPDVVFLLRVDVEQALERIRRRGTPLQVHETREFLAGLQAAYELTCSVLGVTSSVHVIDAAGKSADEIATRAVALLS